MISETGYTVQGARYRVQVELSTIFHSSRKNTAHSYTGTPLVTHLASLSIGIGSLFSGDGATAGGVGVGGGFTEGEGVAVGGAVEGAGAGDTVGVTGAGGVTGLVRVMMVEAGLPTSPSFSSHLGEEEKKKRRRGEEEKKRRTCRGTWRYMGVHGGGAAKRGRRGEGLWRCGVQCCGVGCMVR